VLTWEQDYLPNNKYFYKIPLLITRLRNGPIWTSLIMKNNCLYNVPFTIRKFISASVLLVLASLSAQSQYAGGIVIEKLLQTDTTSTGQIIVYPKFNDPEITMSKITFHPGQSTGWHKHTFPVFAYVLKGTLTVELEDHRVKEFKENSTYAEVINTYHNGTNNEESDLVIIALYMGGRDHKLSVPKEN
jgi:quercetin dioxygenase-like cupin family protein